MIFFLIGTFAVGLFRYFEFLLNDEWIDFFLVFFFISQFNGEPQSYTRFNLAPNADGESSHVEVKLSGVAEEEVDGIELGHHHPDSTYTKGPQRTNKKILYAAVVILIVFLAGKMLLQVFLLKVKILLKVKLYNLGI